MILAHCEAASEFWASLALVVEWHGGGVVGGCSCTDGGKRKSLGEGPRGDEVVKSDAGCGWLLKGREEGPLYVGEKHAAPRVKSANTSKASATIRGPLHIAPGNCWHPLDNRLNVPESLRVNRRRRLQN